MSVSLWNAYRTLFQSLILPSLLYSSSSCLSALLAVRPWCYHFNVVASSAVICSLVMCQCARERWHEIRCPFLTARFRFSVMQMVKKVEGREREKERALLFQCGGRRWHPNEPWPPTLTHSVIYTHQYPHNLCHSSYCSTSLFHHYFVLPFQMCVHTRPRHTLSPDVSSSSLLWAELSHSHRHQPLRKGSWSWEKHGPGENGKRHVGVSDMMTVCEAVVTFIDLVIMLTLSTSYIKRSQT